MNAHSAALPLYQKKAKPRVPAARALVSHDTMSRASSDDTDAMLLDFDDGSVIAGIVRLAPAIPPALRDALEQMMTLRFGGDSDRLDDWLHAGHPALHGASPFVALAAGDGVALLRTRLMTGELSPARYAPVERRQTMLGLVR